MDKAIKIALILTAVDKMSAMVDKAVSKSSKRIQSLNSIGSTAGLIGGAISGVAFESLNAARESEIANKRIEQVFRSMGETTNDAAKAAEDYASKLQMQIGVEDEVILATQAKIATFKSVSDVTARMSGVFDRATNAAFDMAAAGFGEADQNAVQLGKALEDPIQGINALRRSGISFTESEKAKIKVLVESGQKLKAQQIVLNAVEKQVKGVAAATADPIASMNIAWGEVGETIGKQLLPHAQNFSKWLADEMPKINDFISKHEGLTTAIGATGAAMLAFGASAKIISFVLDSTLVKAVYNAVASFSFMGASFTAMQSVIITSGIFAAIALIGYLAYKIYDNWEPIKAWFLNLWTTISVYFKIKWKEIKDTISNAWQFVKDLFFNYTPLGIVIKNWDKIKTYFSDMWTNIKATFTNAWDWIMNLGSKFYDAGANIMTSIWNGIKAMVNKPIEAIEEMTKKMRAYLPFSPAKEGAFRDLHRVKIVETIAASIKPQPALQAMAGLTNSMANYGGGVGAKAGPKLAQVNSGGNTFNINVNISGNASQADAAMIGDNVRKQVLQVLRDEENRKKRVSFNA